jgi:NADH:ubiquinone oxidoreductase subunit C
VSGSFSEQIQRALPELKMEAAELGEAAGTTLRIGLPGSQARVLLEWLAAGEDAPSARLIDLTVVDRRDGSDPVLEVVYRLEADAPVGTLRVHARIAASGQDADRGYEIGSVVDLWPAAGWLEREAREFFGVQFKGAGQIRPLLLDCEGGPPPLQRSPCAGSPDCAGGASTGSQTR